LRFWESDSINNRSLRSRWNAPYGLTYVYTSGVKARRLHQWGFLGKDGWLKGSVEAGISFCFIIAVGVNLEGHKELLGLWLGEGV
jgi:hypothetical protein